MQHTGSNLETKGMLANPGNHFKGRFEVERKFRVDDISPISRRLKHIGAVPFTIGNSETDVFLDFEDRSLMANNQFQILRHMTPSDRVLWISKGPTNDQCTAVDLADFDKALSMLRSLRLKETCQITKKRDIYFLDEFHITLDKLEGLGSFVELAVMTDNEGDLPALRGDLQRVAKELDLHRSAEIFQSYRQLLFG